MKAGLWLATGLLVQAVAIGPAAAADWRALCAEPQSPEALEACEAAVESSGDSEALHRLGALLLRHGDEERALRLLAGLAERQPENSAVQFDYAAALATVRNYQAAARPITAALRLGARDVRSYRLAAIIYEQLARPEEAFVFHHRLARLGDSIGMADLAWDYAVGRGTEADLAAALSWYEKAADLGHVGAMLALAEAHRIGDLGLAPDAERAQAWDDRAARAVGGD